MRRAERTLGHQPGAAAAPGDAVDARHLDRLRPRQRRQDRGQPPREHRLADPGGPESSRLWPPAAAMVSASTTSGGRGRRRDRVALRQARATVSAAVGRRRALAAAQRSRRPAPASSPPPRRGRRRGRPPPPAAAGRRAPPARRARFPRPPRARRGTERISPPSAELAEDRVALERVGRHLAARREDRARDGEVEARARLAQGRRREVDGDALERELEARVEDRRAHALARLAHRAVAQADDREARQARRARRSRR